MKNNSTIAGVDEVGRGCLAGPVVSAAVILNNKIDLNLINDSKKINFQNRLKMLGEKYDIIGDARGIGLLGCLEGDLGKNSSESDALSVDYKFSELVDAATEKRGLFVRPIINMCVFSPPLIITKTEIDIMFDILDDALSEVQNSL